MTSVGLVATGGTIASRRDTATGSVRSVIPADELLTTVPGIDRLGEIITTAVATVNGWNMTPELMLATLVETQRLLADPTIRGVVVTHGTDTIEETAFLLDITNPTDKPIVCTCAMRGSDEVGADGPRNLLNAFSAATSQLLHHYGATICVNDELHAARWAVKVDTEHTCAFSSPEHGPLARITPTRGVLPYAPPPPRWAVPIPVAFPHIPLIKTYTGMDLNADALPGLAGLVLEGTGLGNVPGTLEPLIKDLVAQRIPVVIATRVLAGGTAQTYGGPGGGASVRSCGALFAGRLTAAKARLLLGCVLAASGGYEDTCRVFDAAVSTLS